MIRASGAFALAAALSLAAGPARAGVVTDDFRIRDARDLVDLCGVEPSASAGADDPLYDDAINFCHGFVSGAWQFHQAMANGPHGVRLVCPPDPPPTRSEAVTGFVAWAKQQPTTRLDEPAIDVLFRYLTEKYPCPQPAAPAKKGGAK